MLCEEASKGNGISLNTDGTTKHQRKLGRVIANGVILGVNELADGKAITAVKNIHRSYKQNKDIFEISIKSYIS